MTMNVQVFELSLSSTKVYNTDVDPNGNKSPGEWDLVNRLTPERSVAVGSTQNAAADPTPNSTSMLMSFGQFDIPGLVVSAEK